MKHRLYFLFYSLLHLGLSSQNQNNTWYFGNRAGLNFNTNPPTVLVNSAMKTPRSSACISDVAGNILFYTNSDTVWYKQHQYLANGGGIMGNKGVTQSVLIVKQPGNANLYYIFHFDGTAGQSGLQYTVVDMALAAGMGSVTTKNSLIHAGPHADKLNATLHCNGQDVWIMCHDFNSNQFRAYLLTTSGINPSPVLSVIGPTLGNVGGNAGMGEMKFSPNGSKLGMAHYGLYIFEVYDFDNATGMVTNQLQLNTNLVNPGTLGFEFSPDGTKAYGTGYNGATLFQWNLCAGSVAAIVASQYTVSTSPNSVYALQLAPDGQIYAANFTQQTLGVISNPNSPGASCNYSPSAISLAPKTNIDGLPNFMSNYFFKPATGLSISHSLNCQRAGFGTNAFSSVGCTAAGYSVTSMLWDFNDPASGAANSSTLSNPVHQFSTPGTYSTQVIVYYKCRTDTAKQVVTVSALSPTLTVSGSYSVCKGGIATFTAGGANTFSWSSSGSNNSTVALTPSTTSNYTLMGTNTANSCTNELSFAVQVISPSITVSGNYSICAGEKTTFTVNGANTYSWSNASANSTIILSPTVTTTYAVTGTTTANSCTNQVTFTVNVSKCLGLQEKVSDNKVLIYPNPNKGIFTIELTQATELRIIDVSGQLIYKTKLPNGKTELNLSDFSRGLYFVELGNKCSGKTLKLVLE